MTRKNEKKPPPLATDGGKPKKLPAVRKKGVDSTHLKYHMVINNPLDHGFDHAHISETLQGFKNLVYYCLADEKAEAHHTHIYVVFSRGVLFSSMKRRFSTAHIEAAKSSSENNRQYIKKEGKWRNDEKHGTAIPGSFEEWGVMPVETPGTRTDMEMLLYLIKIGKSNAELLEINADYLLIMDKIERTRQTLLYEQARKEFRMLDVTYIYGPTGVGKTRFVMESETYEAVYKITDYDHPFDGYSGQPILLLDEFHSGLRINDMLNYLDGYPLSLPARYSNKTAVYTKVFIIANIELNDQYPLVQLSRPEVWAAFLRRIDRVMEWHQDGTYSTYTMQQYQEGERDVSTDPEVQAVFDQMELGKKED